MSEVSRQQALDFIRDLLVSSARLLAEGQDFESLRQALRSHLQPGIPGAEPAGPLAVEVLDPLSSQLALRIWNETPLPQNGLRPQPRINPERNKPCLCGSGRKYKQCCGKLAALPFPVPESLLLAGVLQGLPPEQLAALPMHSLRPQLLHELAALWSDAQPQAAVDLLSMALQQSAELEARHAEVIELLLHLQTELNLMEQKGELVERLMHSQEPQLQASGWRQIAMLASEQRNWGQAWQAYACAQQLAPHDLALPHLEILLLLREGRRLDAQARVGYWRQQLRYHGSEQALALIPLLEHMVEQGLDAVSFGPVLPALKQVLNRVEPACLYQLQPGEGQQFGLQAGPELAAAVQQAFSGQYNLKDASLQVWLELFTQIPLALQSFEVLRVLEHQLLGMAGTDSLYRALLDCSARLQDVVLQQLQVGEAQLPALIAGNRGLLQLAAARMTWAAETGELPAAIQTGLWLLQVDPADGQGVREMVLHYLLRNGQPVEALELAERCRQVTAFIAYGHALALYAAGQQEAALERLQAAARNYPGVWEALASAEGQTPGWDSEIESGSTDEGWIYREQYLEDWQAAGALDWAMQRLSVREQPAS